MEPEKKGIVYEKNALIPANRYEELIRAERTLEIISAIAQTEGLSYKLDDFMKAILGGGVKECAADA